MSVFGKIKKNVRLALRNLLYSFTDKVPVLPAEIEKTLLIVKTDHIGDYVLFRNFLPLIKQSEKYRAHKIVLVGNIAWKSLATSLDSDFYDEMIWISFDKILKNLRYRAEVIKPVLSRRFDTVFYPVYSGNEEMERFFISKIAATHKITYTERLYEIPVFTEVLRSEQKHMFEIFRYREMFEKILGTAPAEIRLRNLVPEGLSNKSGLQKPYFLLFPDSQQRKKRWSTAHFSNLALTLLKKYSHSMAIIGGGGAKGYAAEIISKLPAELQERVADLTGKTTLSELASVISGADLLVTNDSVSIHMAAVYNTPAVCVFMGENYGRFGPYPQEIYSKGIFICPPEVMHLVKSLPPESAFLDLGYYPEINKIKPETVAEACYQLLGKVSVA